MRLRLYMDHLLPRVLARELSQRGFIKSNTLSVHNEVAVFLRNSVRVELRGGDSVAVFAPGFTERHEGLAMPDALNLVERARKLSDGESR